MSRRRIAFGRVAAEIDANGAQLRSLTVDDIEYLWAATEPWLWSAPVLFPIISGLPNDELIHGGMRYPIVSHGFARRSLFTLERQESSLVRFSLSESPSTLASYPYRFLLQLAFELGDNTLTVTHTVTNTGDEVLPFMLGGHPAFRWPLPGADSADNHTVSWMHGGETMRQAVGGLRPGRIPSPAVDGRVRLERSQFAEDAMLFDDLQPREVTYSAPNTARVILRYDDFRRLGIWSKREHAEFVCLEPWSGYPAPQGFDGEFSELPEVTALEPGDNKILTYSITIEGQ